MNYGFKAQEASDKDYIFGAYNALDTKFSGRTILQENGDWTNFLPVTEPQAPKFETQSCVSHGTLNVLEVLKKRQFDKTDNLSDRFLAKESGTNWFRGNTPREVGDALRKKWTCNEAEWSTESASTLEDYYKEIPNSLKTMAIARGAEYEFGYEIVQKKDIKQALQYSPLGLSVPAWHTDKDGKYYRPEGVTDNHWVMCYGMQPNGDLLIFDTYYPYLKTLRADVVPSVIMGYYLKRKVVDDNAFQKFLKLIDEIFRGIFIGEKPVYPDDVPQETPKPEPKPVVRDKAWRGGTLEHRRAMYKLSKEVCASLGLDKLPSRLLENHTMSDDVLATIYCESGFNQWAENHNNKNGTADYGLCQFNDGKIKGIPMWIGKGAVFASVEEVLNDPAKCAKVMAKEFKNGHQKWWYGYAGAKKAIAEGSFKELK